LSRTLKISGYFPGGSFFQEFQRSIPGDSNSQEYSRNVGTLLKSDINMSDTLAETDVDDDDVDNA